MTRGTEDKAASELLPRDGLSAPRVTAARYVLLFCVVVITACTRPTDNSKDRFGIITSDGMVLAIVEGSVPGLTNSGLTRLIRSGVAETYSIQCDVSQGTASNGLRMFWYLIDDRRKGTALVKVRITQDGKVIRSEFTNVAAPEADPDAMFMDDIARFVRGLLPPAAKPAASSQCS